MRTFRALAAILAGALALSGCSTSFRGYGEHKWRKEAEAICFAKGGFQETVFAQRIDRIRGDGPCGIWQPLKVSAALGGMVAYSQPERINCPTTSAIDGWFWQVVQPAALKIFGMPVVQAKTMGSYNCRNRNNKRRGKLSEHSFGNAIDFGGFVLSNGREITVLHGWRGAPDEQVFLREIHKGACSIFTTVIGPDGDRHHRDHFHLDLARHNENNSYTYCR